MNLPSIKRAGSPHYTVIRLKTSFRSATYRPKAHRPIYRDLGALVHSKYLHHSVRLNALIVGTWSRSSSLRVHARTTKRGHCCRRSENTAERMMQIFGVDKSAEITENWSMRF